MSPRTPPHVLFLGVLYAGHKTQFLNLRRHTQTDNRIEPTYRGVTGWEEGGLIERLTPLPAGVRGRVRGLIQARHIAQIPRPDAIWTGVIELMPPYLWSQVGPLKRPMILDTDWTLALAEGMAQDYFGRPAKRGIRRLMSELQQRAVFRATTFFTPWTRWAADGLRRAGIPEERIRILPPGVDLTAWQPHPPGPQASIRPLRVLFVGGDFVRKGGDMLVDVMRSKFADSCEAHIITRDPVQPGGNVFVHRAEPNSPELREQYARADVFCLPTRAEAFGIAAVEALASGLPVILGNVGGTPDIVQAGITGWLIEPNAAALAAALSDALARREDLPAMGARARADAEQRFAADRNARIVVDLLLEAIELERERQPKRARPA